MKDKLSLYIDLVSFHKKNRALSARFFYEWSFLSTIEQYY